MEAATVVTPILEELIEKLGSAIWKELGLLWGVKDDLKKLESLFLTVSAVLEDAERRPISDRALQKWLKDLKDAAFDADDVLDEFQTEAVRWMNVHDTVTGKVRRFFSSRNSIIFRLKMAQKIKAIIRKLNEIAEEKEKFHLAERDILAKLPERETFSFVIETEIFGRDGDKERVMEWLSDRDNDKDVSVLPIVGLGGVGKTTLAQLVFNDEKIKKHFHLLIWVCVGEVFDVKDTVKAILENMKVQCTSSRLEDMQTSLREKIMDKRYLLVLDDVWNEDALKWEPLKFLLRGRTQGNKIIVTTRSQRVGEIMGTVDKPYILEVLSHDDCWTLFKQRAFGVGREEDTPNLVQIGKEIVKKCGGLPLAAKSLGSLMATKRGEAEWLTIKDSELWRSDESIEGILPALQLSYDHLPPQLKKCFAYCSIFPEDCKIDKLTLIQLWLAEGFVTSKDGMHAEDIGARYFNILLGISFFQYEEKDDFGDIISCKVHDLVRNLACFVAKDESATVEAGRDLSFPSDQCRYLSVIGHDDPVPSSTIVKFSKETRKLRSLIMWDKLMKPVPWDAVTNLTLLRVLDLGRSGITEIPSIVGKFKHLKFLNLSGTSIESLPDSIASLYSLQTLKLRDCWKFLKLPGGIKKMSNLRHLDISGCEQLTCMPRGLGKLTNLLTLPKFVIGNEPDHGTLAELKHLNQIRGELSIHGLDKVEDPKDVAEANLSSKTGLQSLKLIEPKSVGILENLQPSHNLKKLKIWSYDGNTWPTWFTQLDLSSSYQNLVELELWDLDRCESLPPLGQLPSLKRLVIFGMDNIKKIGAEFYGESGTFPSLKYMELGPADQLEEWLVPSNRVLFPSLDTLIISTCPRLTIQPCLPSSIVGLNIDSSNEELLGAGGCLRGLSRLRNLQIKSMGASETSWKGLSYLIALEKLEIASCEDLICLPVGMLQRHLSTLQTLELSLNTRLESLGGGGGGGSEQQPPPLFSSLRHLTIYDCPNLTALPEWLRSLQTLKELKIRDCPDLKRRCERGTGEDWLKIAHIPNVDIWRW